MSPAEVLDAIADEPDPARRDALFERLVAGFDREALIPAVRERLGRPEGHDGEAALRLVEALGDPALVEALLARLRDDPDLPPDRLWLALSILDAAGRLEGDPDLADLWDELRAIAEEAEDDHTPDELAALIEGGPDDLWIPLHGLGSVEPDARVAILADLARRPFGPGLAEFFRLLSFAHDPTTRESALTALAGRPADEPDVVTAWAAIAADHPDEEVVARARRWLGLPRSAGTVPVRTCSPRIARSRVSAVDGEGRASILIAGESAALFVCDMLRGVVDVIGRRGDSLEDVEAPCGALPGGPDLDAVEDAHELALGLLSGALSIRDPSTTPALRFWVESAIGRGFRPRPFAGLVRDFDPATFPIGRTAEAARQVLDSCPSWADASELTGQIAREIRLREGTDEPDPARDAGAYRFLFEHHLQGRLELYRRMLFWMASFWEASASPDAARSALAIAWQLSDAQHAVPGHPFAVALTTRSLARAMARLRDEES